MAGKMGRGMITLVLLLASLSTIACLFERLFLVGGSKSDSAKFSGSGNNRWSWENDTYSCDIQNEMTLTINDANEAVLKARGGCLSLSYVGDPVHYESGKCEQINPANSCVVVVYGTYNPETEEVSFDSCNNPKTGNGGGTAVYSYIENSPSLVNITGDASCTFSNTDEQHYMKFTLPRE